MKLSSGKEYAGDTNTLAPNFTPGATYIFSFDQSTTCTGIAIARKGVGPVAALELETLMHGNRNLYVKGLYNYVRRMVAGLDIHDFLIEDVFEGASPSTYKILRDLRNMLMSIKKDSDNDLTRIERVNNFVWKSEFFQEVDLPNKFTRENSKALSRQVSLQKYPWMQGFKEDAYDAMGILDAYCTACYDGDWSLLTPRKINKFIYSEERHYYDYQITTDPTSTELYAKYAGKRDVTVMRYNTELTPQENAYLSTALHKTLVISEAIPHSNWHAVFCIEQNIPWKPETQFYLIAAADYA